jgi:hypothetical protein
MVEREQEENLDPVKLLGGGEVKRKVADLSLPLH